MLALSKIKQFDKGIVTMPRRKKEKGAPTYKQHALLPQLEPPPKRPKNPPKDDPKVLANLAKFETNDEWLHTYSLYLQKVFTKGQAAKAIGVGSIEFGEQIKLYKASPEKKQEKIYTIVLRLLVQCINLSITDEMRKFEAIYLQAWYDKLSDEEIRILKDTALDIVHETEGN